MDMKVDKSRAYQLPPCLDDLIRFPGSIGPYVGNGIPINQDGTVWNELMALTGPADYDTAVNSDGLRPLLRIT